MDKKENEKKTDDTNPLHQEMVPKLKVTFRAFDRICVDYFDANIAPERLNKKLHDICWTYILIDTEPVEIPKELPKGENINAFKSTIR